MSIFKNKSILVTGGTGSFGKEFIKNILTKEDPKKVIVYSRDELKQYEMENTLNDSRMRFFIGDVRDSDRLVDACENVDVIIHAAALKQVISSEYNPMECIKTNILGAQNIINAAIKNKVKTTLALSTDKAANPINLYGSTKLASDKLFIAANNIIGSKDIKFSIVRYGNVLGSRGSVLNLFRDLIKKGKNKLPITDDKMTRFIITLDEGVNFVKDVICKMKGGEIFIPKLPSIKIIDMAYALSNNVEIEIIGIRPGEKLHEVLCPKESNHLTIEFNKHFIIKPSIQIIHNYDYYKDLIGETGTNVNKDFEYISNINDHWLDKNDIQNLIKKSSNEF
tara:strand:- start:1591 stop:2601 length:1011 start_codon:yes stop_codon:yes gene_type:complete